MVKEKKVKEKQVLFLAPISVQLTDKLSFSLKVGNDGIAKFCYEEEFSNEKLVKRSVDVLKKLYDIPGMEIRQDGLKVLIYGKVPVKIAVGVILGEVLAQAVYYVGKGKVQEVLKMFPLESDYVSGEKFTKAVAEIKERSE